MNKTIAGIILSTTFFIPIIVNAQVELSLWKDEPIPYYKENNLKEYEKEAWGTRCIYNITQPTITIYEADGKNSGKAVIIIPGGGYELVALYHEGHDVAKILSKNGITAAVLKYRLPHPASSDMPHMVPLSDGRRALEIMHNMAPELGVDTNQIGVLGFSAGSHLATVLSLWNVEESYKKPDFSGLIYGVTDLSPGNLEWLEKSLYHRKLSPEEISHNTLLEQVNKDTPPAFLAHAYDDDVCLVKETALYAQKLHEYDVAKEVHLFQKGGHGFGIGRMEDGTDKWVELFIGWLQRL